MSAYHAGQANAYAITVSSVSGMKYVPCFFQNTAIALEPHDWSISVWTVPPFGSLIPTSDPAHASALADNEGLRSERPELGREWPKCPIAMLIDRSRPVAIKL